KKVKQRYGVGYVSGDLQRGRNGGVEIARGGCHPYVHAPRFAQPPEQSGLIAANMHISRLGRALVLLVAVTIAGCSGHKDCGRPAHYTVPYFVAVTEGSERILARRNYSVAIAFEPGQTTAMASEHIESATLHTDKDKQPYDYQVLVGLQLTRDQLQYNRQSGH